MTGVARTATFFLGILLGIFRGLREASATLAESAALDEPTGNRDLALCFSERENTESFATSLSWTSSEGKKAIKKGNQFVWRCSLGSWQTGHNAPWTCFEPSKWRKGRFYLRREAFKQSLESTSAWLSSTHASDKWVAWDTSYWPLNRLVMAKFIPGRIFNHIIAVDRNLGRSLRSGTNISSRKLIRRIFLVRLFWTTGEKCSPRMRERNSRFSCGKIYF